MSARDPAHYAILVLSHTLKANLAGQQLVKLMDRMCVILRVWPWETLNMAAERAAQATNLFLQQKQLSSKGA
jgi:hypothetical protein